MRYREETGSRRGVGAEMKWAFRLFRAIPIICLCLLSACSTSSRIAESAPSSLHNSAQIDDPRVEASLEGAPSAYRQALDLLSREKFDEALIQLEMFLRDMPTSRWTQATRLNIGRALEGLGRFTEAGERYREVIRATTPNSRLQAAALYRLSFCSEALGNDQQVVAVLSDVVNRGSLLSSEVIRAEVPARLAAAYARVGNFDRAVDFYRQAEAGILRLRREWGDQKVPEWLPRTLFYMGNMSLRQATWNDFETSMRPLARGQVYLLQSAEYEIAPWSQKAAEELILVYRGLWNVIERAPEPELGDPLMARRALQEAQWDRAILLQESLRELRARAQPYPEGAEPGPSAMQVFSFATDLEAKITKLLLQRPFGEGLTSEAFERRKRVRARVITPDDALERLFMRNSREIPNLTEPQEQQDNRTSPGLDPNL
jgi:tetratricopeptide (TPR) repeat protein